MKRLGFVLVLIVLAQPVQAAPWLKSLAEAQAEAKKKNAIIFVDLFAEWCGWCHKMEREVFPSEAFQNVTKDMVLLRVNTEDRGEGTRLSIQYGVASLPTFLMITHDQMVAGMISGYAPANDFARRVSDLRGSYDAFLAKVKEEPARKADYAWRLDLAREFVGRRGWKEAETRLNAIAADKKAPKESRDLATYNIALMRHTQGRADEAKTTASKLLASSGTGEAAELTTILLGQIYLDQRNYRAALSEFQKFGKTFPKSAKKKEIDELIPKLQQAIAENR